MKLWAFALRNIRLNRKKYMLYFGALIFSVFTSYTFLALMHHELVIEAFTNVDEPLYQSLLLSSGLIMFVFVTFFLISSNNSFIKARKKEISTYVLFGMTYGKIARLLLLETFIVGVVALIVGIGFGMLFSKLMARILLEMIFASVASSIFFTITVQPIVITVLLYVIIFLIMGLSSWRVVYQFELVDLFKAEKMAEKGWEGSYTLLTISVFLIGIGYALATINHKDVVSTISLLILLLVIPGTYFFYWGGLPQIISIIKKSKRRFYKGDNLIAISSFSHQMKSISSLMATITVLSAVAVTAIATGYTLYSQVEKSTYQAIGYDFSFSTVDGQVTDQVSAYVKTNQVEVSNSYAFDLYEARAMAASDRSRIYALSEYNHLMSMAKSDHPPVTLQAGEALYLADYAGEVSDRLKGELLTFLDVDIEIAEVRQVGFLSFSPSNHAIVLSDDDFIFLQQTGSIVPSVEKAYILNYESALKEEQIHQELASIVHSGEGSYQSAYATFHEGMQMFGLFCFIGFFICVLVILMTASLLYFKQVTAAVDEKHQFIMLRKVGMNEQLEKKVINKRLLPIFLIPLLFGMAHSLFAMKGADTLFFQEMNPYGQSYLSVLGLSSVMYVAYGIVYGLFYLITRAQYSQMVK